MTKKTFTLTFQEVYNDYLNDQKDFPTDETFYDYLISLTLDGVIHNKVIINIL